VVVLRVCPKKNKKKGGGENVAAHLAVSRVDFVAAKGANKPFQQTTVAHIIEGANKPFGHRSGLNAGLLGASPGFSKEQSVQAQNILVANL